MSSALRDEAGATALNNAYRERLRAVIQFRQGHETQRRYPTTLLLAHFPSDIYRTSLATWTFGERFG